MNIRACIKDKLVSLKLVRFRNAMEELNLGTEEESRPTFTSLSSEEEKEYYTTSCYSSIKTCS